MLDVRKVANNMNSMEDSFNESVKCSSFTDNLIEAYDINQCDTSITLMEKEVVSESIDRAIWVALESERMLCEKMMNDALLEKEDKNIFVRAWEKFKSWMQSFWNWITRKKVKSTNEKAKELTKDADNADKIKQNIQSFEYNIKLLKQHAKTVEKRIDKIPNFKYSSETDKKKMLKEAQMMLSVITASIKARTEIIDNELKKGNNLNPEMKKKFDARIEELYAESVSKFIEKGEDIKKYIDKIKDMQSELHSEVRSRVDSGEYK